MFLIHAALALGALAAAIPAIIHLLHRPRPRVLSFPAMRLIQPAIRRASSRLERLRRLLLLLLRALALLLLAFALAGPMLPGSPSPSTGELDIVLILDDSASTAAREPDGTRRIEQVRAAALALLERLDAGSCRVAVLSTSAAFAADPQGGIATDFFDQTAAAQQAIARLSTSGLPGSLPQSVERAVGMLHSLAEQDAQLRGGRSASSMADPSSGSANAAGTADRPRGQMIVMISDLTLGDLPGPLPRLPDGPPLAIVQVGAQVSSDVALDLDAVRLPLLLPGQSQAVQLEVRTHNGGPINRPTGVLASLSLPGAGERPPVQEWVGTPALRGPGPLSIELPRLREGPAGLSLRLTDHNAWPLDDSVHVAFAVQQRLRVLLVEPPGPQSSTLAMLAQAALRPARMNDDRQRLEVLRVPVDRLTPADVEPADAIVLVASGELPARAANLLLEHVRRGRTAILLPALDAPLRDLAFLAGIGSLAWTPMQPGLGFAPPQGTSALAELVPPGWWSRVRQQARLEASLLPAGTDVLLAWASGAPAAWRVPLGSGSLVLLGFSAEPQAGDLAAEGRAGLWLILLHHLVERGSGAGGAVNALSGQVVELSTGPASMRPATLTLHPPDGPPRNITAEPGQDSIRFTASQVGLWRLRGGGRDLAMAAVNHPAAERSGLRPEPAQAAALLGSTPVVSDVAELTLEGRTAARPWALAPWLAALLLLVLLAEAMLGRSSPGPAGAAKAT